MPGCDPQSMRIGKRTAGAGRKIVRCSLSPSYIRATAVTMSSRPNTPTSWSICGYFCISRSLSLSARQPVTITPRIRPLAFQIQHFFDGPMRFFPGVGNKPAGIYDHEIGARRLLDQAKTVQPQQARHPLGVDQILRAAQD